MFYHEKRLQYHAKPDAPDPLFAMKMQEVLGGQWGEMSVMMTYLFQGWNCRGPMKYRDMILDIGTEEIGHVEMLATMIARLLEGAPLKTQEDAARVPIVGAVLGGDDTRDLIAAAMNPQHLIVSGGGALPSDSMGFPWTSRYTVASGNLLADFRFNVTAESQGRLQVARLFAQTEDKVHPRGFIDRLDPPSSTSSSTRVIDRCHPPTSSTVVIHRLRRPSSSTGFIHRRHPSRSTLVIRRRSGRGGGRGRRRGGRRGGRGGP